MQPQTDAADFQAWKARRKAMWMAAQPSWCGSLRASSVASEIRRYDFSLTVNSCATIP